MDEKAKLASRILFFLLGIFNLKASQSTVQKQGEAEEGGGGGWRREEGRDGGREGGVI